MLGLDLSLEFCLNYPLLPPAAKSSLMILVKSYKQSLAGKIFEGDMSIRILPKTLLQMFC